jgi:hypothetical protein
MSRSILRKEANTLSCRHTSSFKRRIVLHRLWCGSLRGLRPYLALCTSGAWLPVLCGIWINIGTFSLVWKLKGSDCASEPSQCKRKLDEDVSGACSLPICIQLWSFMFIWCGYRSGFFLLRGTHPAETVNVERLATRRNDEHIWIDGCKIRCSGTV